MTGPQNIFFAGPTKWPASMSFTSTVAFELETVEDMVSMGA